MFFYHVATLNASIAAPTIAIRTMYNKRKRLQHA